MADLPLFDPFQALEEIRRESREAETGALAKTLATLSPEQAREITERGQALNTDFDNSSNSSHPGPVHAPALAARPREERKK